MNGKLAKKIRAAAVKQTAKRDEQLIPELKEYINSLPLKDRIVLAWRMIRGRF